MPISKSTGVEGTTSDTAATAGGTGSLSAKLRRATQGLEDLKTLIVLAAGSARIGKVTIRNSADGADIDPLAETTFTGRIGEVQASPTANTVLDRLKTLATLLSGGLPAALSSGGGVKVGVVDALPAGTNAIGKSAANDGVDIGDVTINNASGGSAVNVQDGGNSLTVDGTVGVSSVPSVATTPGWTDNVSLVAIQTVALNAVLRTTFSLNGKLGAMIYLWLGRGGTTALTNGVDIRIRRTHNNGAFYPTAPLAAFRSQSAACVSTTCTASGSPNNAGVTSLTVASTTSFAAGDVICIQDNASPTSLTEWAVVARVTSSTVLLLDAPTINAHNNTAHTVRNKADYFTVWVEGGPGATTSHELLVDYGDDAAGEAVTVYAVMQTLNSMATA